MLSREQIVARLALSRMDPTALGIHPAPVHIGPASIDLRLGKERFQFRHAAEGYERIRSNAWTLQPQEFALASSLEMIRLPSDVAGRLEGRSAFGRLGLQVHGTAGLIDPGFFGQLTFEVSNLGTVPLRLETGVRIAQLAFFKIASQSEYPGVPERVAAALGVDVDGTVTVFRPTNPLRIAEFNVVAEPWVAESLKRDEELDIIAELERIIARGNVSEHDLQKFIERHAWRLLGNEYADIRPQVVLERQELGTLRPDFFLKPVIGDTWDILDLKLPEVGQLIVGQPDRRTYSSKVASGIAQLRQYGRYFDDASNRRWVESKYGIFAYRPRLRLIIGTHFERGTREERIDVRRSTEVEVVTYRELIQRLKHIRR
jgi:dCTP deaminase